jgi:hypothetical protein
MTTARTELVFAHIADLPPWITGMALLNSGNASANIEITAYNPNGSLVSSPNPVRFSMPPQSKTARLLREWIPQTPARTSDGGWIRIRSSAPIFGLELFFTSDLRIIVNIGVYPP